MLLSSSSSDLNVQESLQYELAIHILGPIPGCASIVCAELFLFA
jgi:hypothetical protein